MISTNQSQRKKHSWRYYKVTSRITPKYYKVKLDGSIVKVYGNKYRYLTGFCNKRKEYELYSTNNFNNIENNVRDGYLIELTEEQAFIEAI